MAARGISLFLPENHNIEREDSYESVLFLFDGRGIMTDNKKQSDKPIFELLAPAGSMEIFRAVIAAGADAVYLGGDQFGARAYANNFTREEVLEAIDYAHLHGRKVYMTVNTLLKNQEIKEQLFDYLLPFYERGLDAVLVQDFGALSFIREAFCDLPVHTSTQMTVTSADGAGLLAGLGATRVVMAREVSLAEMKQIQEETGVELEAFVHGALCYCYSGQCLLSSMIGGRSGNRGRCAQPCRLPYSVLDDKHREYLSDSYVLSLKDLCGLEDLHRLHEAGVYSLKIEGRMKQIPYAAGIVSYYRKYIDLYQEMIAGGENIAEVAASFQVEPADQRDVFSLGNRCGFTDGYYDRQNGSDMVTFTKPSYEKQDEALQQKIVEKYSVGACKIEIDGHLILRKGEAATFALRGAGAQVEVSGMEVMEALKKPLLKSDVQERMQKTGDTPFTIEKLTIDMQEGVFLPNGALNQLRRDGIAALERELLQSFHRNPEAAVRPDNALKSIAGDAPALSQGRIICLTEKRELLPIILERNFVSTVYLDAGAYDTKRFLEELKADVMQCKDAGKEVCLALPRIFRQKTAALYLEYVKELKELPLDGIVVRTYEELEFVKNRLQGIDIILDHGMYTYNDYAVRAFAKLGASRNTVPLELNGKELAHRDNRFSEMVVYGHYPLMTSAQCVHGNTKGCDHTPTVTYLRDRYKMQFPVKNFCCDCYNVVYNSLPTMLFTRMEELHRAGIQSFRLDFSVETGQKAEQVLDLFEQFASGKIHAYPKEWQERYTGGHYRRGVE